MVVTCAIFSIRKEMDPFWFYFASLEMFMLGEYAISENVFGVRDYLKHINNV